MTQRIARKHSDKLRKWTEQTKLVSQPNSYHGANMAYIATTSTEHQISHPLHTLPPTVISLNSRCWYPHQYHSYLWELPLLLYHKSAHSPVSLLIILLSKPWKGVKRQIRFLSILSPDWYWSAKIKKEKKKKKNPYYNSFLWPTNIKITIPHILSIFFPNFC